MIVLVSVTLVEPSRQKTVHLSRSQTPTKKTFAEGHGGQTSVTSALEKIRLAMPFHLGGFCHGSGSPACPK